MEPFVHQLLADICRQHKARGRAMIIAEANAAAIAHVQKWGGADRFGWCRPEGVAILPLLMAMTGSVFVNDLLMVFVAGESVL